MTLSSLLERIFPDRARTGTRQVIVNADDFGMNSSINTGAIAAHERGIVTSASLMVRHAASREAAAFARAHDTLDVGLHIDLGEWVWIDGAWAPRYVVVDLADRSAVEAEIARQVEGFRQLVGRDPTHLDSHQHVHREEPVRSVALALAARLGIPLRHFTTAVQYCGRFHAHGKHGAVDERAVGVPALMKVLAELPEGISELCCHPGVEGPPGDPYGAPRPKELATLCDRRVRRALTSGAITMRTFRGVPAALRSAPLDAEPPP